MKTYSGRIQKAMVYLIIFLMLGITGILNIVSFTSGQVLEKCAKDDASQSRSSVIGSTSIDGYIELWDVYSYSSHDGIFDDENDYYYKFHLGSKYTSFRLYLQNIDYTDRYLQNIVTHLKPTTPAKDIISVTSPYYNLSYIDKYDYEACYYNIEINSEAKFDLYELALDIYFYYVDEYYDYHYNFGTIYFKLQLTPRINTNDGTNKLKLTAIDRLENSMPLYSSAKNQLISLKNPYSSSETLSDVEFSLKFPDSFKLESKTAAVEYLSTEFYTNDAPIWLLKDVGEFGAKAQEITGTCTVSYKLNNKKITEKQLPIIIEITETPILSLNGQIPESEIGGKVNGKIKNNFEFFQSANELSLLLKFKNDGNIDLKNVEVELYTENSEFFYKSSFYYDENNYGTKQYYGEKIELGDIAVGQSETKLFTINMKNNIPPGLYKIPIKYTAIYSREGLLDVDLSVNDFHEKITAARMLNNKGYTPFVLLNILEGDNPDDIIEPDLLAYSTTSLQQGMNRVLLEVELTNLERYRLNNVYAYISAGGSSPIRPLNELKNISTTIEAQEKNFLIFGYSDSGISHTFFIHFLVDIDNNASSGVHKVPITLTCLDNHNQERTTIVLVELYIKPVPPSLVISDVTTTDIKSNEIFFLTMKVFNCGGSEAKNVKLMFNGSSNLFSAQSIFQELSSIKKDKEEEFNFTILAGEVELGKTYTSSVLISYDDILGNHYSFTSNAKNTIPLKVNTEEVETDQKERLMRPRFILSDVTTTDIVPNNNFTLTIKLFNYGEHSAGNLYIMFNDSSNLFSAADSIYGPYFISENTEIKYEYTIMAGEVEPGGVYTSSILLSYFDLAGNSNNFYENPSLSIKLYVKEKEETSPDSIIEAQKNETGIKGFKAEESDVSDISNGFAMIILGLFILISTIIFSVIHYKVGKTSMTQKHQELQEIDKIQEPGKIMVQHHDAISREQIMPTNQNLDKDRPKIIRTTPTPVPTTVTTSASTSKSSVPSLPPASESVTNSSSTSTLISTSTTPKSQQQKPHSLSQSTQQMKPKKSPSITSPSISPKSNKKS